MKHTYRAGLTKDEIRKLSKQVHISTDLKVIILREKFGLSEVKVNAEGRLYVAKDTDGYLRLNVTGLFINQRVLNSRTLSYDELSETTRSIIREINSASLYCDGLSRGIKHSEFVQTIKEIYFYSQGDIRLIFFEYEDDDNVICTWEWGE